MQIKNVNHLGGFWAVKVIKNVFAYNYLKTTSEFLKF